MLAYVLLFSFWKSEPVVNPFRLRDGASTFQVVFSLLAAAVGIPLIGVISSMVIQQGEVGWWFIASNAFGAGFIIYVFGPLWTRLDLPHENQFLVIRYAEPWASRLLRFRGWYVGGVVSAILLAMLLRSFAHALSMLLDVSANGMLWLLALFLLINSHRTSLPLKRWSDPINLVLLCMLLGGGLTGVLIGYDAPPVLPPAAAATLGTFPYAASGLLLPFLVYVSVQWWSAGTFDASGTTAQRLMGLPAYRARRALWLYFLMLAVIVPVIGVLALFGFPHLLPGEPADSAVFALLRHLWPGSKLVLAIVMIPLFIGIAEAQLNWAGSLLSSTVQLSKRWQQYGAMVLVLVLAGLLLASYDTLQGLFQLFLGVSAGVSLLFMLRWWIPYINAQVQLAGMIGATVCTGCTSFVLSNGWWDVPVALQYSYTLLAATGVNLVLVIIVAAITYKPADAEAYRQFRQQTQITLPTTMVWVKAALAGLLLVLFSYGIWRLLTL